MRISLHRVEVFDVMESYKFLKKVLFSYAQYMYAFSGITRCLHVLYLPVKKGYVVDAYRKTALKLLHKCNRCSCIGRKYFLQNGDPSLCFMFAVDKNSVYGLTRFASANVHHAVAVSVATTRGLR